MTRMRIGDVATPIRGLSFAASDAMSEPGSGLIGCLTTSGVHNPIRWTTARFLPRRIVEPRQVLQIGDILVSTANSKPMVGKSVLVPDLPFECTFGAFVTTLRPKPGIVPSYLSLWMQTDGFMVRANELASQTTNIANLRVSDLLAMEIEVPDRVEDQRRLAGRVGLQLSLRDDARQTVIGLRIDVDRIRAQAYEASFGREIPFADRIPIATGQWRNWNWTRLTRITRLESGHTPSRRRPDWWGGDIPWIQLADIRAVDGRVIHSTSETTNPEGIAHSAARILPAGTVVMSRTASVGFVARLGRPMATSQDFVNWVCGPDLDPEFLMHLLIRSRDYIR